MGSPLHRSVLKNDKAVFGVEVRRTYCIMLSILENHYTNSLRRCAYYFSQVEEKTLGWIHFNRDIPYRNGGNLQSVGNAAYIHRTEGYDSLNRQHFDYTDRAHDLLDSQMIVPETAPEWVKDHAKEGTFVEFWEELEQRENEYLDQRWRRQDADAIFDKKAKTFVYFRETIALPLELNQEQNMKLAEDYVRQTYTERGITAQYAVHWEDSNPHVHVMGAVRELTEKGVSTRHKDFGSSFYQQRDLLLYARKTYADLGNQHLTEAGFEPRLDHRSYKDQGLDIQPTTHEGYHARKITEEGKHSPVVEHNNRIRAERVSQLDTMADLVLKDVSMTRATFTEADLMRQVSKVTGDDLTAHTALSAKVMAHQDVVRVGTDLRGKARYSTADYVRSEEKLFQHLDKMQQGTVRLKVKETRLNKVIEKDYSFLSEQQRTAVQAVVSPEQVVAIEGRAGAGKTTLLKVAGDELKAAGHRVYGLSLSGAAADNLERETGIKSSTIDKFLYPDQLRLDAQEALDNGQKTLAQTLNDRADRLADQMLLSKNDVLIVDEAGMAGTRHYEKLLEKASAAGAKVVLVGDSAQKKAVAAGGAFEMISQKVGAVELSEIRRQKVDWQREASVKLADGNVREAIKTYHDQGRIAYGYGDKLRGQLVDDYVTSLEGDLSKAQERLVMAATNKDVKELNDQIRKALVDQGHLKDAYNVRGRHWDVNDRIVFMKNQNSDYNVKTLEGDGVGVKNGSMGQVEAIHQGRHGTQFDVRLDGEDRLVRFRADKGDVTFAPAYAVTIDKAQGRTVDKAYVWGSDYMRNDAAYVAMTRHREDVKVYSDINRVAGDPDDLATLWNRAAHKDMVADYKPEGKTKGVHADLERFRELGERMKEMYPHMQREAMEKGVRIFEHDHFADFQEMSEARKEIAQKALDNWSDYARASRQLNITQEQLKIMTGQMDKPLSRVEKAAFDQLRTYADVAERSRDLWNEIKQTHQGPSVTLHPKYQEFNDLRLERDALAHKFAQEKELYGPLARHVKNTPNEQKSPDLMEKGQQRVSWKAIEAQAERYETILDQEKVRTSGTPERVQQLDRLERYEDLKAHASNAFAELKQRSDALGTKLHETGGYDVWRGQAAKVEEAAFNIREAGHSDLWRLQGVKEKDLLRQARAYEITKAIEEYKAAAPNDYLTRDRRAYAVEAIVQQDPDKRAAKAVFGLAKEQGVDYRTLKRQATYHEVRTLDRSNEKIDAGRVMERYDRADQAAKNLRAAAKAEGVSVWDQGYREKIRDQIAQREKAAWALHRKNLGSQVETYPNRVSQYRKDVQNHGIRVSMDEYRTAIRAGQRSVIEQKAADIMRKFNAHPAYKTERHMAGYVRSEGATLKQIKQDAYFSEVRRAALKHGREDVIKVVDATDPYIRSRRAVGDAFKLKEKTGNGELFHKELAKRNKLADQIVRNGGVKFVEQFGVKGDDIRAQARTHRVDFAIEAYGKVKEKNLNKGKIALDLTRNGADKAGNFDKATLAKMHKAGLSPETVKRDALHELAQQKLKPTEIRGGHPSQSARDQAKEQKFNQSFHTVQMDVEKAKFVYKPMNKTIQDAVTQAEAIKKAQGDKIINNAIAQAETLKAAKASEKALSPKTGPKKLKDFGFDFDL